MKDSKTDDVSVPGEERRVFKVVNSSRCSSSRGFYAVQYRVGTFVSAPAGMKLFVFDSLENAYDFGRLDRNLRVWRATAKGLSAADRRVCDPKEMVDIEDYWRVHNAGGAYSFLEGRRTPPGTLWADEVRLDERVPSEELPQRRRGAERSGVIEKLVNRLLGLG